MTSGFGIEFEKAMDWYNSGDAKDRVFVKDVDACCARLASIEADEDLELFQPPSELLTQQVISESMVIECLFLNDSQVLRFCGGTPASLKLEKAHRFAECGQKIISGFYFRYDDMPSDVSLIDLMGCRKLRYMIESRAEHQRAVMQSNQQLRAAQGADALPMVARNIPDRKTPGATDPVSFLADMPTVAAMRKKVADMEEKRKQKDQELSMKLDGNQDAVEEEPASEQSRLKGALSSGTAGTVVVVDQPPERRIKRKGNAGNAGASSATGHFSSTPSKRGSASQKGGVEEPLSHTQEEIKKILSHDAEMCKVALKLGFANESLSQLSVSRARTGAKLGVQCHGARSSVCCSTFRRHKTCACSGLCACACALSLCLFLDSI